ncbi:MAG TPA: NYN domain-containing protein [Methylomirabilota bacterium]|jgi:predicted RNA-binding protein with PIN domain|nr:NYN domain-containing protein [Methylomirabilota bacterium]
MPVPVVIDGYNLLYARGESPSPESRARLVRDLVRWARARTRRVELVFDGWAGGRREAQRETHGPVTVHFTRVGERADAFIVRWVAAHRESVVVTSDRAVQQGARRRGAAVLGAEAFLDRLTAALEPSSDAAPDDAVDPARRPGRGGRDAWLRGL